MIRQLLNGTTIYSSDLPGQNLTTAGGESLLFTVNGTGQYVTDSATNKTARIIQPDVLLANGVLHVIDRVFLDTDTDPSAASAACVFTFEICCALLNLIFFW